MTTQLDLDLGRKERDEGLQKVIAHHRDWHVRVIAWIRARPPGWLGTTEDVRIAVVPLVGEAAHPNAWGAVMNDAREKGWIVSTGVRPRSKMPQNHARRSDRYKRTKMK